jgi:clumping factor A
MRPERPLPALAPRSKKDSAPLYRAHRIKIDPTKCGASHIVGERQLRKLSFRHPRLPSPPLVSNRSLSASEEDDSSSDEEGEGDKRSSASSSSESASDPEVAANSVSEQQANLSILKSVIGADQAEDSNSEEDVGKSGGAPQGSPEVESESESEDEKKSERSVSASSSSTSSIAGETAEDRLGPTPTPSLGKETDDTATDAGVPPQSEVEMKSLTAIFKPHEAEGASSSSCCDTSSEVDSNACFCRRIFSWRPAGRV